MPPIVLSPLSPAPGLYRLSSPSPLSTVRYLRIERDGAGWLHDSRGWTLRHLTGRGEATALLEDVLWDPGWEVEPLGDAEVWDLFPPFTEAPDGF